METPYILLHQGWFSGGDSSVVERWLVIKNVVESWFDSGTGNALLCRNCNCNYILFTKLPWPGDSEVTFRSSGQAAPPTCLPHTVEASHCPFNCWTSSRERQFTLIPHWERHFRLISHCGQAVYPMWRPSLMKDLQRELPKRVLCRGVVGQENSVWFIQANKWKLVWTSTTSRLRSNLNIFKFLKATFWKFFDVLRTIFFQFLQS